MNRPVFIVSTGRTGTAFLAQTLQHLGARAAHEPGPRWLRLASNAYVAGALPHQRAKEMISKLRSPPRIWDVEASCLIYGLVKPILDVKPDAYVVHLVRDPRTYVRSAMNWGVHRLGGRPLNLIPYRRLAPPHVEGRSLRAHLDWVHRDQFERVCWTWRTINTAIADQGKSSDRFSIVRMEDLFNAGSEYAAFRNVLDLAGIPTPSSHDLDAVLSHKVNAASRVRFPVWQAWPTDQLNRFLAECGELGEQFGYPVISEARRLLEERST